MNRAWWLGPLGALLLVGCGGGGGSDDDEGKSGTTAIASTPLSGKASGAAWTLGAADADSAVLDPANFWVEGYGEAIETCGSGVSALPSLLLLVPKSTGDHPLGLSLTATFYDPTTNDNLVATTGHIRVDSITATQVTGGAFIEYDTANTVNGQFTVTICP